jgi:glutathione S-transferase
VIYHLALAADWAAAQEAGEYAVSTRGATVAEVGYVHASFAGQVAATYQRFYADAGDVVLLTIDEARLRSPVVVEQLDGAPEPFPHVYGPIELGAVVEVRPYP